MFLHHPLVKLSISGSLRDREVACSASDPESSNFESCIWRVVSSHSSHHPQEVADSFYFYKTQLLPCFSALTATHVRGCVELDTSAKILPSMSISTQHLQYIVINVYITTTRYCHLCPYQHSTSNILLSMSTSPQQDTAIYVHINTAPPIYCYQYLHHHTKILPSMSISTQHLQYIVINSTSPQQDTAIYVHINTAPPIYCYQCLHHHNKIPPYMSISTQHLQYIVINVYITTPRYCHLCPYQHSTSNILLSIPRHHNKILPSMSISTQHLQYIFIHSTSPQQDTAIYVHINTAPPIYCYQFYITTTRYCHLCPYQHSTSNILLSMSTSPQQDTAIYVHINTAPPIYCYQCLHHHTKILPSMSISTQHLQYIVINSTLPQQDTAIYVHINTAPPIYFYPFHITTTRYCHLCPYQHSTSDISLSIPHHHTKILSSVTIWLAPHNILLLWTTECQIPYIIWAKYPGIISGYCIWESYVSYIGIISIHTYTGFYI